MRFAFIIEIAEQVRNAILPHTQNEQARNANKIAFSGDTTFEIDVIAEQTLHTHIEASHPATAYFSEDKGLVKFSPTPKWILVVDPIDGTRPLVCGLETSTVSIALCNYSEVATFGAILAGVVLEIKSGKWLYAEQGNGVQTNWNTEKVVRPTETKDIARMFWSFDIIGRPAQRVMSYLGPLIDKSGMAAGAFLFNSAAFSLTRIVTGHLDAYVDVGGRLLSEIPAAEKEFEGISNTEIMGTFPYDLAGAYIILKEAGCPVTDAFGESIDNVLLLQHGKKAVMSCIAASTPELHRKILDALSQDN